MKNSARFSSKKTLMLLALLVWTAQAPASFAQVINDDDGDAAHPNFEKELVDGPFTTNVTTGGICPAPFNFEGYAAGTVMTTQIPGVTISSDRPGGAMIFDSDCAASPSPGGCSGGDDDLGSANQAFGGEGIGSGGGPGSSANTQAHGKILIVSEDGDSGDPDDHAAGGKIFFDFDQDMRLGSVDLLDMDDMDPSAMLRAYDAGGNQIGAKADVPPLGDNSYQRVSFEKLGVRRLEVFFRSSGGLAAVNFCNTVDLEVDLKTTFAANPEPGDLIPFTVDVFNNPRDGDPLKTGFASVGNLWPNATTATGVEVTVRILGKLSVDDAGGGTVSTAGGFTVITYNLGTLTLGGDPAGGPPSGIETLSFTLKVDADATASDKADVSVEVTFEDPGLAPMDIDPDSDPANMAFDANGAIPVEDEEDNHVFAQLPVELTSFDALVDGRGATLRWQTASETNNAGFEIQHRYADVSDKAATAFEALDFVAGAGTTLEAQSYSFRTDNLEPGRHVFRLKQLDYDGSFAYSPEVEVAVEMPEAFLVSAVYPNPFNPEASFSFGVRQGQQVTVSVFNMLGQQVLEVYRGRPSAGVTQTVRIDGSGLRSGTYVLRVLGERFVDTQTFTLIK